LYFSFSPLFRSSTFFPFFNFLWVPPSVSV